MDQLTDDEEADLWERKLAAEDRKPMTGGLSLHIDNWPDAPASPQPIDHSEALKGIQDAVAGVHGDRIVEAMKRLEGAPSAVAGLQESLQAIVAAVKQIEGMKVEPLVEVLKAIAKEIRLNTAAQKHAAAIHAMPIAFIFDGEETIGARRGEPEQEYEN